MSKSSSPPRHPGEMVRAKVSALGLPVAEVSKKLGVTQVHLSNIMACRCGVTPRMAVRLEVVTAVPAETWMRMQMEFNLAQFVRELEEVRSGGGGASAKRGKERPRAAVVA
jgi:addiction module HigA family antidote